MQCTVRVCVVYVHSLAGAGGERAGWLYTVRTYGGDQALPWQDGPLLVWVYSILIAHSARLSMALSVAELVCIFPWA